MNDPHFKVGDLVRIKASERKASWPYSGSHTSPQHLFEVMGWCSANDGQVRYRVQGSDPSHRLIVREDQLIHASKP